ncbi:AzlC family ABC transporter permease [Rhodococcus artemisiae]|uniref:AzlC family ABC transporter permease n=1 Tax=Rhodococcus artemisiae TaxID=714159 RepID=A0ABU7LCM6_9NOCA|nr:AzlC family ABC transporter permease [Rhodococcus artemisiae]MEE2058662.1 AzlC family ABC transporter permease [Rhodococcus artemisiae]
MSMPDSRATAVRAGIADSWAVGLGLIPLGLAFGVVLTQGGFDWWWAPIFSIVIYAGSMEFLAIGLISAVTPFASIAAATLLVNFRHVFYGLSFPLRSIPLGSIYSRIGRLYAVYALTDEAYAIIAPKAGQELSGTRVLTVQVLCQAMWVVSGTVGALIGAVLPAGLTGLEFALTALFTVLAIDAFRVNRDVPATVIAVVCGLVAMLIAKEQMLVVGLGLFVACLLARFVYRNRAASA